jgi:uncharacterized repeat protein (TIGR01451 family)
MLHYTIFNLRLITVFYTAILLIVFHLPAHAAAPGALKISSIAEQVVESVDEVGKKESRRIRVVTAVPGDEVIYTTTFENISNKPAGNIVITNPVPNDTIYKSAAGANTDITFSIDGGKQYAIPEKLIVTTKEGLMRSAVPADYTHMRWAYKGELDIGKTSDVSFRASIK